MTDTGFIFSLVSDVLPGFRNIWYSPIIPYNLLGVYRVEQIMEISDFSRKREGIHRYLENNINVHNEFSKLSIERTMIILNKIGNSNNKKCMNMRGVYICKICYKSYRTVSGYKSHTHSKNKCVSPNKSYSCIFCNQLFTTISHVRKHVHSCELSIKNHLHLTKLNNKNKIKPNYKLL